MREARSPDAVADVFPDGVTDDRVADGQLDGRGPDAAADVVPDIFTNDGVADGKLADHGAVVANRSYGVPHPEPDIIPDIIPDGPSCVSDECTDGWD